MLIIGDIATKEVDKSAKVSLIEIIYNGVPQRNFLESKFGLKKGEVLNPCTTRYKKDKKTFLFHNSREEMTLQQILDFSFADNMSLKVAKPTIQYIFDLVKIKYIHKNTEEWQKSLFSYQYIKKNYIDKLDEHKAPITNKFYRYSTTLHYWMKKQPYTMGSVHIYRKYDIFKKFDIIDVIKFRKQSCYRETCSMTNSFLFQCVWIKFSRAEKMECVVEKLYTDTLNDYLITDLVQYNREFTVQEVTKYFKRSVMNCCTRLDNKWLATFIMKNYLEIMRNYTPKFYQVFVNAYDNKDITIIKN
tara:strand:- start:38964 stop:39869 length:906 start_codon:yes stop_codon:yes gene_type:complete